MNDYSEESVQTFGRRSSLFVWCVTGFFALFGGGLALFSRFPLIWAAWIPLCFLLIPPVHFVCREMVRLQQRVKELERKLEQR
jgi:hypothetical protein